MIIRITALFLALKQKKLNVPEDFDSSSDGAHHTSPKTSKEVRHRGSLISGNIIRKIDIISVYRKISFILSLL